MMIRFDSGMIIDLFQCWWQCSDVGDKSYACHFSLILWDIIHNHASVCNRPEDILNYLTTSRDPQMKHDAKIFIDVDWKFKNSKFWSLKTTTKSLCCSCKNKTKFTFDCRIGQNCRKLKNVCLLIVSVKVHVVPVCESFMVLVWYFLWIKVRSSNPWEIPNPTVGFLPLMKNCRGVQSPL